MHDNPVLVRPRAEPNMVAQSPWSTQTASLPPWWTWRTPPPLVGSIPIRETREASASSTLIYLHDVAAHHQAALEVVYDQER